MSIFSSIGKVLGGVGKAIGKTALNVGGGIIGDNHLGTDLFGGTSSPTVGAPVAPGYNIAGANGAALTSGAVGSVQTAPSFLDELKGFFMVASGNKPIQTSVSSPAFPDWLLPAGLILAALLVIKALK